MMSDQPSNGQRAWNRRGLSLVRDHRSIAIDVPEWGAVLYVGLGDAGVSAACHGDSFRHPDESPHGETEIQWVI